MLPPDMDAHDEFVIWGEMQLDARYQVVWSELHSHWPIVDQVWLIAQSNAQMGLNQDPWVLPSTYPVLLLKQVNHTVVTFRKHLRRWAGETVAHWGSVLEFQDGAYYSRYNYPLLSDTCFPAGQKITLVATIKKHSLATSMPGHLHIDAFSVLLPCSSSNHYDPTIHAPHRKPFW